MKKGNHNVIYYLDWVVKIGFLAYSLLSFNSLCYGKPIISFVLWPTIVIGAVVLVIRLIKWKQYYTMPGLIFLCLFIVSYIVSAFVNIRYGYREGIVKLAFLLFYFFIFFAKESTYTRKDFKKEINILGWIMQVYMFICVLVSFGFMIFNYTKVETVENGWDIGIGFLWGRLWGVFTEPNYAAVIGCVVIAFSYYFYRIVNRRSLKIFLAVNGILQLFYIAFTDSRTGRVALAGMLAFFVFNRLNYRRLNPGSAKKIKIHVICVWVGIAIIAGMLVPKAITYTYNQARAIFAEGTNEITRGYDLSNDPTNRRLDIWKSGIEVFSTTPVFGTSYTNILPYTMDNCEGTYLIDNSAEKNFSSIHNEILNVLVGQGIFGFIVLLGFVGYVIVQYVKYYFKTGMEEEELLNTSLACCMAAVMGAMTLTGMFYSNSPAAVIFWCLLGNVLIVLKQNKNRKEC